MENKAKTGEIMMFTNFSINLYRFALNLLYFFQSGQMRSGLSDYEISHSFGIFDDWHDDDFADSLDFNMDCSDNFQVDSGMFCLDSDGFNPANGLPMVGGFDIDGNLHCTNVTDHDFFSSSSLSGTLCSFDDI